MQILDRSKIYVDDLGDRYVVGKHKHSPGTPRIPSPDDEIRGFLMGENFGDEGLEKPLIYTDELCGIFDGLNTFLDYLQEEMPAPQKDMYSNKLGKSSFNNFDNYSEAMEIFTQCPYKVKKFEEADIAVTHPDTAGISHHYDVTGDFLDIGRFVEGDPEAFGVMHDGNPLNRRVNLTFNLDWWHAINEETLNARSHRIQRLVDWLEAQHIRVSVTAISSSNNCHLELTVKDHSDPLDPNDLAVVSNSDFFRRIVFRFMEYSDTWTSGYGHAFHFNRYLRKNEFHSGDPAEIELVINNGVRDPEKVNAGFDTLEKLLSAELSKDIMDKQEFHLFDGGEP